MRFAIQGDIHNFNRVPEVYLKRMLSDATTIRCSFVAFLGDILDGTKPNPMRLSAESKVPIVWQRGDHEFFGEWGRTCFIRLSQRHSLLSDVPDPISFMRGAMPRFEALTGQPTAWAFILKGVLFIVTHNGKNHVWHDWQIRWLRQLLSEHRRRSTVLLSHRTLDERGETAEALRQLVSQFDQVVLFCDAHIHSPRPFRLFGNALQVGAEGDSSEFGRVTFEGDWYVAIELSKDAIRVLRRRMKTNELVPLYERKVAITLNEDENGIVHLAFLMGDGGVRFNPAIVLRKARMRIWGVQIEQLLPMPDDGQVRWHNVDASKLEVVEADDDWRKLGIGKVIQAIAAKGDAVTLAEVRVKARFEPDPTKVGVAGTIGTGTQYIPLILAKAPKGVRVRMEIDALCDDGAVESRHWVEGESDGGIVVLQGATGHIYLGAQSIFGGKPTELFWRWEGVEGRTEVDTPHPNGKPRRATKLVIRLKALKLQHETKIQFVGFVFPELGGFFMPTAGKAVSEGVEVMVGNRRFTLGDLDAGKWREVEVGEIAGGEKIALRCRGSKLALIELIGETDGIMCHALRSVKLEDGQVVIGELTEHAMAVKELGWDDVAKTCIWQFRKGIWRRAAFEN